MHLGRWEATDLGERVGVGKEQARARVAILRDEAGEIAVFGGWIRGGRGVKRRKAGASLAAWFL